MDKKQLEELCEKTFETSSVSLDYETNLQLIENWDSFGHIQLVLAIEEATGVQFSAEEIDSIRLIRDLIDLIRHKGGEIEW
jgi:acyl carrier protein